MSTALPDMRGVALARSDARQLLQLRGLRLRRAEVALARAGEAVAAARAQVERRHQRIAAARAACQQLRDDLGGPLAARLPRWSAVAVARGAHLDEQVEREEYALLSDERALESAEDEQRRCRQEVARLQQREDLARDFVRAKNRERIADSERRRELELEERRT